MPKFHTLYDPPPSPVLKCDEDSMVSQDAAKECDINYIISRAGAGLCSPPTCPEPVYVDVTDVPNDLETVLQIQKDAFDRFAAMPSRVRQRFDNDPVKLVAFLKDAKNRDEAIQLGIIKAPEKVDPESAPKLEDVAK